MVRHFFSTVLIRFNCSVGAGGRRGRGGYGRVQYYTAMEFNMADFTLLR
jgi:hypothetical protein